MRRMNLSLFKRLSLAIALVGLALLSSCSDENEATTHGKGIRITIVTEDYGSITRSGESPIIFQESIHLGDGIFMDVTVQEDFGPDVEEVKTRTDQPLSDGVYYILGYHKDSKEYAGENWGTVSDDTFTFKPDKNSAFRFHDGQYIFVCVPDRKSVV